MSKKMLRNERKGCLNEWSEREIWISISVRLELYLRTLGGWIYMKVGCGCVSQMLGLAPFWVFYRASALFGIFIDR